MKYSLRSLTVLVFMFYGSACIGLIAASALVMSAVLFVSGLYAQSFQAVASSLIMLGLGAVILFVARYCWREAWREFSEVQKEPPSFGMPPPLPNSSAPAPIPPKE